DIGADDHPRETRFWRELTGWEFSHGRQHLFFGAAPPRFGVQPPGRRHRTRSHHRAHLARTTVPVLSLG
ncbi:VOC family protein, partial [Nocardia farcinica]|uniref:VOC family protein n=1 Tax=Nocardia farcinica TaxID=37329 RepID=UPI00313AF7C3